MNYYTGNLHLNNICRLCLANEPNNVNIFGEIGQRYNLQAKVWKQFNIWVKLDETYPKGICKTCLAQVETFHIYSLKVEAVQQKLMQIFPLNPNSVSPRFEDFSVSLDYDNSKALESTQPLSLNTHTEISYPSWINSHQRKLVNGIGCTEPHSDTLTLSTNFELVSTEIKVEVDPSALLRSYYDQPSFTIENDEHQLLSNKVNQNYAPTENRALIKSAAHVESDEAKVTNNTPNVQQTNNGSQHFTDSSNSSSPADEVLSHDIPNRVNSSEKLNSSPPLNVNTKHQSSSSPKTVQEELIEQHSLHWSKNRPHAKERLERSKKSQKIKEQLDNFFEYICNDCDGKPKFPNFLLLRNHCRDTHNKKAYVMCCKRRLTDRKALIHHMLTQHLQPDEFSCPQCGKSVSTQHMLKLHIINHLPESERPYKCSQCGKGFCSIAYVRKHEKSHHFADEPVGSFMCDECGKSFGYERKLIVHKRNLHTVVENPVMCHICAKTFKHQSALRSHLMTHKEGRTEECPHCHKFFKNTDTVRSHIKQEHRVTPAQCPQCDKTFRSKRKLVCHTKVFHSDEKPYQCKMCQKRFKLKSGLKTHIVQHTGEKPFQCPYCPRTFASSGNWSTHKKRMHGEVKSVSSYVPQIPRE